MCDKGIGNCFVGLCFLKFMLPVLTLMLVPGNILYVEIEACNFLPLRPLDAYPTCKHAVSLDGISGGPYHYNGKPAPDIASCPGVGFLPLGGNSVGQQAIYRYDKRGKVVLFLEANI